MSITNQLSWLFHRNRFHCQYHHSFTQFQIMVWFSRQQQQKRNTNRVVILFYKYHRFQFRRNEWARCSRQNKHIFCFVCVCRAGFMGFVLSFFCHCFYLARALGQPTFINFQKSEFVFHTSWKKVLCAFNMLKGKNCEKIAIPTELAVWCIAFFGCYVIISFSRKCLLPL